MPQVLRYECFCGISEGHRAFPYEEDIAEPRAILVQLCGAYSTISMVAIMSARSWETMWQW